MVKPNLMGFLEEENAKLREEGRFVTLRVLQGAQEPVSLIDGKRVVNLTSNYYLYLSNHP